MSNDPSASPVESSREPRTIRVTLKSSGKTQYCQLAEKSTVGELRKAASHHFSVNKEQMLLIFAGKILKDQETLLQHDIQNGGVVHVVVKRPELRHNHAPQTHPAAPGCSAPGPAAGVSESSGGVNMQPLLRSIRRDLVTLLDLFSELPQHFQHHPELMFQVVRSSTVQSLLSDERNPLTVAFILGVSSLVSLRVMQSRAEKEVFGDGEVAEVLEKAFVQNLLANTKEMAQFVSENPELKAFAQETPQFGRLLSLSGLTKMMVIYKKLPQLAGTVTPGMSLEADLLDDLESFRQLFVDIRQVLSSPEVQDELEERMLRHTLETSPSLIRLAKENPSVGHMLSNPKIVGEIIRYIRKPEVRREMDRHCDRILSNLESFPGGHNILQRMYKDIEEPIWSAMEQQHENPFATQGVSPASNQAILSPGLENRAPLPDPWVSQQPPPGPQGMGQANCQRGAAEAGSLCPEKVSKGAQVDFSLESGQAEGFLLPEVSNASPETPASSLQGGKPPATEPPSLQAPAVQSQDLQELPGQTNASPREGLSSQELLETEGNLETSTETPPGSSLP
ncbi:ubiquilin-3-like [Crotalus adamanteus]|uniref:Ubiquilin-3-like n=1 Tax=Crotalus adamanteus TaxID=8729 RepID=A0AAW1BKQ5_CROAD